MRFGIIEKFHRIFTARNVVTKGLAVVSAILAIIIVLTYYGSRVGGFVIEVDGVYNASIALSVDEKFNDPTTLNLSEVTTTERLVVDSLPQNNDASFSYIPSNITDGIGAKNDTDDFRYLAYSFVLINTGTLTIDYELEFSLVRTTKNLDDILRVMIIKDDVLDPNFTNLEYTSESPFEQSNQVVYAKKSTHPETFGQPEPVLGGKENDYRGETYPFIEDQGSVIIREEFNNLQAGSYHKYTIVMWIDGWDQEQTNDMFGAAVQTELNFKILRERNF
ncbi:hypothetical protein J6Y73_01595 [bacterium]|nr:hypothetical protein [bacterium]